MPCGQGEHGAFHGSKLVDVGSFHVHRSRTENPRELVRSSPSRGRTPTRPSGRISTASSRRCERCTIRTRNLTREIVAGHTLSGRAVRNEPTVLLAHYDVVAATDLGGTTGIRRPRHRGRRGPVLWGGAPWMTRCRSDSRSGRDTGEERTGARRRRVPRLRTTRRRTVPGARAPSCLSRAESD